MTDYDKLAHELRELNEKYERLQIENNTLKLLKKNTEQAVDSLSKDIARLHESAMKEARRSGLVEGKLAAIRMISHDSLEVPGYE